jgi:hypothetical protein
VGRPALEVADIFRDFGPAWRDANRGHVSHAQLKVMNAIEACRTAALGGYIARSQLPTFGALITVVAVAEKQWEHGCVGHQVASPRRAS